MQFLEESLLKSFEKLSLLGDETATILASAISCSSQLHLDELVSAAAQGNLVTFCSLLDSQPHLLSCSTDSASGMTAFIAAAKNGHFAIIEEIIIRQSLFLTDNNDVEVMEAICSLTNAADVKGNTALHYACMNDYIEIVDYLISAGADTLIENGQGMTASQLADSCELKCLFFQTVYEECCGICLDSFAETQEDIAGHFYMCGHVFHLSCISNLHSKSKSLSVCPYCRAEKRPIRLVQQVVF